MNDEKMLGLLIKAVYSHNFRTEEEVKGYFRERFGNHIAPKDLGFIRAALNVVQAYRNAALGDEIIEKVLDSL